MRTQNHQNLFQSVSLVHAVIPTNIDQQTSARGRQISPVYDVIWYMKLRIHKIVTNFLFRNSQKVSRIVYQQISDKTIFIAETVNIDMCKYKMLRKPFS